MHTVLCYIVDIQSIVYFLMVCRLLEECLCIIISQLYLPMYHTFILARYGVVSGYSSSCSYVHNLKPVVQTMWYTIVADYIIGM